MIDTTMNRTGTRILVIDDELAQPATALGRQVQALVAELRDRDFAVIEALSFDDGAANIASDAAIHAVLLDFSLGRNDRRSHERATTLLRAVRRRNPKVPIFLLAEKDVMASLTVEVATLADEFVWILEDTATFIAGRVAAAIDRYRQALLPPFAAALFRYDREREYSWAAPGHQGGVAFTKSPVGRVFFDAFGDTLFRTDMGIERGELGSLLSHSGPIGESERFAARVFGAHRSYSVLNGTSGSNRVILSACVGDGEIAVCDRNCHKSIEQGLAITGGIPVFLRPSRNRYGIIGPIPPSRFAPRAIADRIAANPLARAAGTGRAVYGVVTNCTYDGICYNAASVERMLGKSVDRIHFDEAWYGYARFHPLYRGRHAMRGDPATHPADGPTVFATHSTHKLLAALSQTSYIHIRDGRRAIDHDRFNEAYCAQATTSPLYAMIASNDIAAAMMDGSSGQVLTHDVIEEAVACRQALGRMHAELGRRRSWFFAPWNAEFVTDPASGRRVAFHQASHDLLATEPGCWVLHPGEAWHGFDGLPDGWCMLDPIKFGVVCPGMTDDGSLAPWGIPADLVTAYLARHGIVPSRTTDHMVLFLFSMGVTKGKWGTLINALLDFKADYDRNVPLAEALPALVSSAPSRYGDLGLKDLGQEMWSHLQQSGQGHAQRLACATLPAPATTPRRAFQQLMAGDVEKVPLDRIANRTAAVGVIPYPPGIPLVMPGEQFGPAGGPWISYLRRLEEWGARFPGFAKEVEGAEARDGRFQVYCLKQRPPIASGGRR